MATDLLVNDGIHQGEELLRALDRISFPVTAALWYLQAGSWRYVLASSLVDQEGPREAYRQIDEVLRREHIHIDLAEVAVVSPSDPLITLIRSALHTGPTDVSGIRFTANTLNRVYIEDAYIYRAA